MTTLYLVRHAQAEGNVRRTFQGHTDAFLSETGLKQLEHLTERFRGVHLDAVYSSPLRRAYQTAQALNAHLRLPISTDHRLIEINGGDFEGVPFAELPLLFPEEEARWDHDPANFHAPSGESMRQVYARMKVCIESIVRDNTDKTIAVASHGCAIRNYLCYANGWGIEHISDVAWCDNTAVSLLEYNTDLIPHIVYQNDAAHLPEEDSTFAKQTWWQPTALQAK